MSDFLNQILERRAKLNEVREAIKARRSEPYLHCVEVHLRSIIISKTLGKAGVNPMTALPLMRALAEMSSYMVLQCFPNIKAHTPEANKLMTDINADARMILEIMRAP